MAYSCRFVTDPVESAALWRIREDGAGLAARSLPTPAYSGWEDAAMPPDHLFPPDEPLRPEGGALGVFGPLFAAAIGVELCIAFIASGLDALDTTGADVRPGFGSPEAIGQLLLTRFLVPFEAASYLLLVAAVGAVVLARRRRGLEETA